MQLRRDCGLPVLSISGSHSKAARLGSPYSTRAAHPRQLPSPYRKGIGPTQAVTERSRGYLPRVASRHSRLFNGGQRRRANRPPQGEVGDVCKMMPSWRSGSRHPSRLLQPNMRIELPFPSPPAPSGPDGGAEAALKGGRRRGRMCPPVGRCGGGGRSSSACASAAG
jgi:hypothetical protein